MRNSKSPRAPFAASRLDGWRRLASSISLLLLTIGTSKANAQRMAQGFGVERLSLAPAGAAFLVMNDLAYERLGAALSLSSAYARNPFVVADTGERRRLSVISDQAFVNLGVSLHYGYFRASVDLSSPIYARGQSGNVDQRSYTAPSVDLGSYPDKVTDLRLGLEARLLGDSRSPVRLGVGSQLFVPSGERQLYFSDGTYRAIIRLLAAGDTPLLTYAAHLGLHLRPLSDGEPFAGPRGNELMFGAAIGPKFSPGVARTLRAQIGPEFFGQTALRSPFTRSTTALEVMLSARLEHLHDDRTSTRYKLGFGEAVLHEFGSAEWRVVGAIELQGNAL